MGRSAALVTKFHRPVSEAAAERPQPVDDLVADGVGAVGERRLLSGFRLSHRVGASQRPSVKLMADYLRVWSTTDRWRLGLAVEAPHTLTAEVVITAAAAAVAELLVDGNGSLLVPVASPATHLIAASASPRAPAAPGRIPHTQLLHGSPYLPGHLDGG